LIPFRFKQFLCGRSNTLLLYKPSLGYTYLFISVLCNSVSHSKYFLAADTIKIAHSISSATDSTLPQSHIHSICCRCAANLILAKLKSSPLQGKIIQLIIFTNCMINAQLILTASKIWQFFRYCILYSSLKMLPLTHALYCFCTVDSLLLLYFILFRSKLEYTLRDCNITTTNANKLECVKWKFAALSFSHYFSHIPYNYAVAL
jgi:RNase P subunit RPR2